jgi:hypothetical protein
MTLILPHFMMWKNKNKNLSVIYVHFMLRKTIFQMFWRGVDEQLSGSLLWQNDVFLLSTFCQMHIVINISLDLLIGTWI